MNSRGIFFDQPLSFDEGFRLQSHYHAQRISDDIPDTVMFLEHHPVVTLGTRARDHAMLASRDELASRGIECVVASRGGDATYHGPGQLIMYPILKLGCTDTDANGYLYNLEEIAIRTCSSFGVKAHRRDGKNGAWTSAGKIAAIGFRIRRWVTLHGMSFNVNVDLDGFSHIVPCGLVGEPVTRLQDLVEGPVSLADVRDVMASHFAEVMMRPLEIMMFENVDQTA